MLLTKASEGGESFSYPERVFFVACEFWAAARSGALRRYVSKEARSKLQEAEEAFGAIGLIRVKSVLHLANIEIQPPSSSVAAVRVAKEIEQRLALIEEPVDEALESFAHTWGFS
jgi:hypothetical protein